MWSAPPRCGHMGIPPPTPHFQGHNVSAHFTPVTEVRNLDSLKVKLLVRRGWFTHRATLPAPVIVTPMLSSLWFYDGAGLVPLIKWNCWTKNFHSSGWPWKWHILQWDLVNAFHHRHTHCARSWDKPLTLTYIDNCRTTRDSFSCCVFHCCIWTLGVRKTGGIKSLLHIWETNYID